MSIFRNLKWVLVLSIYWTGTHFMLLGNNIFFSKIDVENGLSQSSVMTIFQDEFGSMWFGTREGLNLYNGFTIEIIQPNGSINNSLSGHLIKNVDGDLQGSVFIHTQNGIDVYDLKTASISNLVKIQVNAMRYGNDRLWYAKDNRVYQYDGANTSLYSELNKKVQITVILPVSDDRIIVGTLSSGVYQIDHKGEVTPFMEPCSQVSSLYEDSNGGIWVSTWENGLYRVNSNGEVINFRENEKEPLNSISSNFVRDVTEDNDGNIWIGTKMGLDKLNVSDSSFYHYSSFTNDPKSLSNESVWSLYKDIQGNIWIGTYFGGVNSIALESNLYVYHDLQNGSLSNKSFPIISQIVEYDDSIYLLCTEGNGLIVYNSQHRTYHEYPDLINDNIKTAYLDREDNVLYLGLHLGGVVIVDIDKNRVTRHNTIKPGLYQSNIVRKILPYEDNLLIATYNGLYLYEKETSVFSVFSEELHENVNFFIDIERDADNNLWIASRGVYKYNINTRETRPYFYDPTDERSISSNNATKIYLDSENRLWIGTSGGGVNLYDEDTDSFIRFNSRNSNLRNDYISNIIESENDIIYITTTQGLSYINKKNFEIFNAVFHDGISLNSLFNGGINVNSKGEVFVAGMNGMVSYLENDVLNDLQPLQLYFSYLYVNNQRINPFDDTNILANSLSFTKKLKFKHSQSILKFEFATNRIVTNERYQYQYRLQGWSDEWVSLKEGMNEINLMNLGAGKYNLELIALSPISKAELGRAEMPFVVTPPFYRSIVAYIIYVIIGILLIALYMRYMKARIRLESSLEFEKKEKEHIEQVNQSKIRFFTNISHEFRTPLTLITSQAEILLQREKLQPAVSSQISGIMRNATLMKNLINELLDFRKLDEGQLKLKVSEYNLTLFLEEICASFKEFAKNKRIDFIFNRPEEPIILYFDQNQLQKVFFNLISNAFKYTPEGGKVEISVEQSEKEVRVFVEDSGIGISPKDKNKIFDSFYQANNSQVNTEIVQGTGLGLALSKGIIEAHHGNISIESKINEGSNFIIDLKKGSSHFQDYEMLYEDSRDDISIEKIKEYLPHHSKQVDDNDKDKINSDIKILIVEDNAELLELLRSLFEPVYDVITAANGEEGLVKTIEQQPDIILSDLMMPFMSGSEMCHKIKTNFAVCHIPVVLLTAQTAVESNIESLKLGADDYITKPFDISVLLARCNNLLNGRKVLQERFAKSTDLNTSIIASNDMDREFLEKAHMIIEENMENPNFGINEFSKELNMGRTSMFNKIKGITGQTPNDFIITYKMKKASYMLINLPDLNISDITYRLGFSSPKYFSKCFKVHFGVSPSKYKEANISA